VDWKSGESRNPNVPSRMSKLQQAKGGTSLTQCIIVIYCYVFQHELRQPCHHRQWQPFTYRRFFQDNKTTMTVNGQTIACTRRLDTCVVITESHKTTSDSAAIVLKKTQKEFMDASNGGAVCYYYYYYYISV